ncbi:hypothetical protein NUM3379_18870 [Kineococcus sp. NUM-3379]
MQGTGPVLDTSRSFTVTAWVRLTTVPNTAATPGGPLTNMYQAAVSQEGHQVNQFYLGADGNANVNGGYGNWILSMPRTRDAQPAAYDVVAAAITSSDIGSWVHLTGTFDSATGVMRIYVTTPAGVTRANEVAVTRPLSAAAFERPTTTRPSRFLVGRSLWGGNPADFWTGSVDDVRAFPRALGQAEATRVAVDPHTSRWTFQDVPATASVGGATTRDAVDTGRTMTLGPAVAHSGGTESGDGKGITLTAGNTGSYGYTGTPVVQTDASFAVSAWVYFNPGDLTACSPTPCTVEQAFVSQDAVVSGVTKGPGFVLGRYNQAFVLTVPRTAGATTWDTATYNIGTTGLSGWVHLVGVQDATAGTIQLYVNGELRATAPHTAWDGEGGLQVGRRLAAGSGNGGSATSGNYGAHSPGTLDTLTTYGWALSRGDVHDLFRDRPSTPRIPSPFGELATGALGALDGPQKLASQGPSTAVAFSGTVGAYSPSPLVDPYPFSLELWFRAGAGSGGTLITRGTESTATYPVGLHDRKIYLDSAGRLVFGVWPSTGSRRATSPSSYLDGAWHHVVGTMGPAGGLRLYVDGRLVASDPTATAAETTSRTDHWRLGGHGLASWANRPANDFFTGLLDEVAVYSRELSAQDVAWHHAADH